MAIKKAKYKIGQIVKIKKIGDIRNKECGPTFVDGMASYCGMEGPISWRGKNEYEECWIYQIHGWAWAEDWITTDFLTDKDFDI